MDFPGCLNGWTIYAHPCFKEQYAAQVSKVEELRQTFPDVWKQKRETKLLAHLLQAIVAITHDPRSSVFRPGNAIGEAYTHWSRAKFGNGRYRLFFRYSLQQKIVVLAWVNDSSTLRSYGHKMDAYRVFERMLRKGNPPETWGELLKACLEDISRG